MRVIANPPLGLYYNTTTKNYHASFLMLLDSVARYKRLKGEEVIFPGRSFNLLGRRAKSFIDPSFSFERNCHKIKNKLYFHMDQDKNREKLNLSSLDFCLDTDLDIIQKVRQDVVRLQEKEFLINNKGVTYLDCPRIREKHNLHEIASGINIFPAKARGEFFQMLDRNTSYPVQITRISSFSPSNPLGGDNIGPLFVLANMWKHKYPNSDFTFAASHNILLKYAFLSFLSNIALTGEALFNELIVWPKTYFEGDCWDLEKRVTNPVESDILRSTFLSAIPSTNEKVNISEGMYKRARNFVYRISNLKHPLKGFYELPKDLTSNQFDEYKILLDNFKFPKVFSILEKEAKAISQKINHLRENKRFGNQEKNELGAKYSTILGISKLYMPYVSELK